MAFLNIAPTGTVLPFAGSTAPEGWLLCQGGPISRTIYATLFAVISTTYGSGDGSTTFNLPDMRGVFPRGQGTNGTANYGGVTGHTPAGGALATKGGQKTAKNGLANGTGTAAGGTGSGSTVPLIRAVDANGASASYNHVRGYASGAFVDYANSTAYPGSEHTHSFSVGTTAQAITGDAETTPASLALNYIIKL